MRTRSSVRPVQALAGILLAAALALTGCSGAGDSSTSSDSAGDNKAVAPAAGDEAAGSGEDAAGTADEAGGAADSGKSGAQAPTKAPDLTANRIIRTASLTVQVKNVPDALDQARTSTANAGGFVGDETTTRDEEGNERTRVVLRVPTDQYDEVLADMEGTGKLLERTAKAQDVTDQVVDVESRIKTQRASVARIRELMDQATKLSDVVTLEGELSTRQADLESLLAQQASLEDRTSLATITLTLSETPVKQAEKKDDDPGFVDALAGGWNAFVTMLRWIAVAFGAILPFAAGAALLLALWVLWVRLLRTRLPRRPAPATASPAGTLPVAPPVREREEGREQD
ncbi:DUF4349 domain-containing protein [Streptomyces sp. NPDC093544]|uniref:DUF4349 domain-containing protein n=1 Tax=Streptomyces sp. NPDC093544 TaxID=3155200 RepID=UPI00342D5C57